jgi:type II secretory pathway pseudopilin PulG
VELVWVILVAGFLTSLAVPTLSTLPASRAGGAAAQLQHDLSYARQLAVATGTTTWVVFDDNAETWSLLEEDPSNPGRAAATAIIDPATGQPLVGALGVDEFTGVEIEYARFDGRPEVGFDWLGRPFDESEMPLSSRGEVRLTGPHDFFVEVGTGHVTHVGP